MRILLLVSLILSLTILPAFAQGPDEDEEAAIEEEINRLAQLIHTIDLRDPGATDWVGGTIGMPELTAESGAGTQIENITFETFDGEMVSVTDLERPVIMNLWASWCLPCIHEFPLLVDFVENELENADFWFVNTADETDNALEFLESVETGDIPVYVDVEDAFALELGVAAFPTTLLLDTDGTLLIIRSGSLTPSILDFFNLVAGYPDLGEFEAPNIEADELTAIIDEDIEDAEPLVLEEEVSGELDSDHWQANYKFEGEEGFHLVVVMLSAEPADNPFFDPYLVLLGPDGTRIAEENDSQQPPHAALSVILPEDGTYTIVATRLLEAESIFGGEYTLIALDGEDMVANSQ
ncbi:MAG: TlpA family protein disulfide reductase [Chloroflexi bacterium]|nr:TlpA family protein disulfide reductase [Chloroflexota bacterium]